MQKSKKYEPVKEEQTVRTQIEKLLNTNHDVDFYFQKWVKHFMVDHTKKMISWDVTASDYILFAFRLSDDITFMIAECEPKSSNGKLMKILLEYGIPDVRTAFEQIAFDNNGYGVIDPILIYNGHVEKPKDTPLMMHIREKRA